MKKNYEKMNQLNQTLKTRAEKAAVETKSVLVDTADLYSNGDQAFIVSFHLVLPSSSIWILICWWLLLKESKRLPTDILWEAVKTGNLGIVSEVAYNMALRDTKFQFDQTDEEGKTMLIRAVELVY